MTKQSRAMGRFTASVSKNYQELTIMRSVYALLCFATLALLLWIASSLRSLQRRRGKIGKKCLSPLSSVNKNDTAADPAAVEMTTVLKKIGHLHN